MGFCHLNRLIWHPFICRMYDWVLPVSTLGQRGEREAARYLLRQGFRIVSRGYTQVLGEIDLIAVDGRTVVFVEVKTRSSDTAGVPAEAVDEVKQRQVSRNALWYLRKHKLLDQSVRFDVVAVTWPAASRSPTIEHYRAAFEAAGVD